MTRPTEGRVDLLEHGLNQQTSPRRLFMQHRRPDLYPEWFKTPAGS